MAEDEKPKPFAEVVREHPWWTLRVAGARIMEDEDLGDEHRPVELHAIAATLNVAVGQREANLRGVLKALIDAARLASPFLDHMDLDGGESGAKLLLAVTATDAANVLAGTGPDYVPKAELDAEKAKVAELQTALEALQPELYKTHEVVAEYLEQKGLRKKAVPVATLVLPGGMTEARFLGTDREEYRFSFTTTPIIGSLELQVRRVERKENTPAYVRRTNIADPPPLAQPIGVATENIRTGDMIEIDFATGQVRPVRR